MLSSSEVSSFSVKVSLHGFSLCHIIKYGDEIMNEITILSQ
jgi:hypothetical protein